MRARTVGTTPAKFKVKRRTLTRSLRSDTSPGRDGRGRGLIVLTIWARVLKLLKYLKYFSLAPCVHRLATFVNVVSRNDQRRSSASLPGSQPFWPAAASDRIWDRKELDLRASFQT